tara:strand:- start:6420 stop:7178 length:759 start_codon:yes stop_codon:yes gene_type:complete
MILDYNNLSLIYESTMAQQHALMQEIKRRHKEKLSPMTQQERSHFLSVRQGGSYYTLGYLWATTSNASGYNIHMNMTRESLDSVRIGQLKYDAEDTEELKNWIPKYIILPLVREIYEMVSDLDTSVKYFKDANFFRKSDFYAAGLDKDNIRFILSPLDSNHPKIYPAETQDSFPREGCYFSLEWVHAETRTGFNYRGVFYSLNLYPEKIASYKRSLFNALMPGGTWMDVLANSQTFYYTLKDILYIAGADHL